MPFIPVFQRDILFRLLSKILLFNNINLLYLFLIYINILYNILFIEYLNIENYIFITNIFQ